MFKARSERIRDSFQSAEDRAYAPPPSREEMVSNDQMFGMMGIQVEKR